MIQDLFVGQDGSTLTLEHFLFLHLTTINLDELLYFFKGPFVFSHWFLLSPKHHQRRRPQHEINPEHDPVVRKHNLKVHRFLNLIRNRQKHLGDHI